MNETVAFLAKSMGETWHLPKDEVDELARWIEQHLTEATVAADWAIRAKWFTGRV